jgi:hypothetical protein
MRAYCQVFDALGIQFYPSLLEVPVYYSFLRKPPPVGPLSVIQQAKQELRNLEAWYYQTKIPAFAGMVLKQCVRLDEVPASLLDVRARHKEYRQTHTLFCEGMKIADSLGKQRELIREHERAWAALLNKNERAQTTRITHLLGKFIVPILSFEWSGVTNQLLDLDKDDQALATVRGLVDLWSAMKEAPPEGPLSVKLLEEIFDDIGSPEHWQQIRTVSEPLRKLLGRPIT